MSAAWQTYVFSIMAPPSGSMWNKIGEIGYDPVCFVVSVYQGRTYLISPDSVGWVYRSELRSERELEILFPVEVSP